MRNRFPAAIIALGILLAFAPIVLAQGSGKDSEAADNDNSGTASRDLSGTWQFAHVPGQGFGSTFSKNPPPMTAWGQAKFDAAKPGYGPRAAPGGNDPELGCDPSGIPRVVMNGTLPFEIVQTNDRVFMFFEWQHLWREIWLNRKEHNPDATDTWMGDSIGHWEGNTLVVDSVGFNDKTWLDHFGNPHSDQMHLMERYERVDHNTLKITLTLDDPKTYTQPWVSDTKIYALWPKSKGSIEELFCVPEEEEAFTRRVRMPAAAPPKQ